MCCIAVCKQGCPQVAAHLPLKLLLPTLSKVVLCPMAGANAMPSNYILSDMMASYMRRHFLNEAETTLRAKPKELPHKDSEEKRDRIASVLEQRPKESSNGEPLGAGLQQYIYYTTRVLCEAVCYLGQ